MRKAWPFILTAGALALIVGFCGWMWVVEGRGTEDTSGAVRDEVVRQARLAESLMPLLDKLDSLILVLADSEQGSEQYEEASGTLADIQNIIAMRMPDLVEGYDEEGDAVIMPTDEARDYLEGLIRKRENDPARQG